MLCPTFNLLFVRFENQKKARHLIGALPLFLDTTILAEYDYSAHQDYTSLHNVF
ncbi:hypothetical protein Javan444_0027 [Streptococcus phage Javan444]|nr:hypothetical protein Javan444_0027 [Streptococcus phage Javan444]